MQVFPAAGQGNYFRGSYGDGGNTFYSEWDTTSGAGEGEKKESWKRFLDIGRGLKISFIVLRTKRLTERDLEIIKAIEKVAEKSKNHQNPGNNRADDKAMGSGDDKEMPKVGDDDKSDSDGEHYTIDKSDYNDGSVKGNNDCAYPDGNFIPPLGIDLGTLANHTGRVGRYEVQWLAEGQMFLMSDTADWYEPVADLLVGDDEGRMMVHDRPKYLPGPTTPEARLLRWRRARSSKSSSGFDAFHYGEGIGKNNSGNYIKKEQQPVPSILKDKTKEELVQEMVGFALTKQTDFTRGLGMTIQSIFWKEEKGLMWTSSNLPREWFDYTKSIGREASSRLQAIQKSKEVASIPGLAEEYAQWFRGNNFFRHSKAYVQMFLAQRCIKFSSAGLTMLSVQAEQRLKGLAVRRDSSTAPQQ